MSSNIGINNGSLDDPKAVVGKYESCHWKVEDNESDCWDTSCGSSFIINDGTPSENDMYYCCYCGKSLVDDKGEIE